MDYSLLTQKPTKEQIDQFEQRYPLSKRALRRLVISIVLFAVMALVFLSSGITNLGPEAKGGIGIAIFCYSIVALFILGIVLTLAGSKKQRERSTQIQLFAEKNNLTYTRYIENPAYAGMFFSIGRNRMLSDVIGSVSAHPPFEIGNLEYSQRAGRSEHTYFRGYVRIKLERNLPQIVLDATSNDLKLLGKNISTLPVDFAKSQRMSLEGDFDKHFSLYAPKEYERDALYIFTPDLMALLIDNASAFDAEIVDDQLFIYSSLMQFQLTNPAIMERLMSIVQVVGKKATSQTDYYSDEKIGDRAQNAVAPGGKRLREGISVFAIIFVIVVVASMVIPVILGALGETQP